MSRCKVVCHIMASIDGKIDGNYMEEQNSKYPGEYYDKQIEYTSI